MKIDADLSPHPRYRLLDRIGKGGMGEVFRTQDRLTGQVVALKRVRLPLPTAPATARIDEGGQTSLGQALTLALEAAQPPHAPLEVRDPTTPGSAMQILRHDPAQFTRPPELAATMAAPPSDSDEEQALSATPGDFGAVPSSELQALRVHLTQEFRTLAGLRHPHIVSVLDYGFDRTHQPYFTMELLEDGIPLDKAARQQPFAAQVGLLLQILQALTYLHRRGVLHRDLKPGNILVVPSPRGPQVKLLDFGLALLAQDLRTRFADIAGTIGYIAPEVLVGAPPSEASDLFAVGVMAHELLTGNHPVGVQPTAGLIREFLGSSPIFSEDGRLSAELSAVLRRALCRIPTDRYTEAAVFEKELAQAAGLPVPAETAEIRESFLQAATFIARGEELNTLKRALDEASTGHGAVWLVGGESGVGKSRLMDELRTLALTRGTRVVRGQAVSMGGGFQVWHGALRPLCLDAPLDALDAGVLKAVVPDIAKLLERPVAEPPALDPENAQTRLLIAAEKLLLSQREPLVVLLEDLHWVEPGSLALLSRLLRSVAQHPLLLIGSYRNDERPTIPSELPSARLLNLPRLVASEMEQLSASMLGEVGKRKDIVTLLERETVGNAFFIVEVVRALAEEVGTLGRIGIGSIPEHVAAGGVQAVLSRRLGRVPESARPLLCAAAVFGKELDLAVLQSLSKELSGHVEEHVAACADVAVLEISENRWRFVHDKLRETLLGELTKEVRASWHLRIGEAMERAYASDLSAHAAALGHHFDQADMPARALPYLLQAGDRATPRGSMHEAITHLDRAVALSERVAHTPTERAHVFGLLCRAYHGVGKAKESTRILEKMFADVGFPMPASLLKLLMEIARLASEHAQSRLGWRLHPPLTPDEIALHEAAVDAFVAVFEAATEIFSPPRATYVTLALVVVAERLRDPARMAAGYALIGMLFAALSIRGASDNYLRRARELLEQNSDPPLGMRGWMAMSHGSASVFQGEWAQADRALDEELSYRKRMGDWRHELLNVLQGGALGLFRGESNTAHDSLKSLEELAHRVDSAQFACWARCIRGALALRAGELDRAEQLFVEAGEYQARTPDPTIDQVFWGISALCAFRREHPAEARHRADKALEVFLKNPTFVYGPVIGLAATTETYAGLWQKSREEEERAELHRRFRQSLAVLRSRGAVISLCRPHAFLWHGRYAALHGHKRLAEWLFRRSLLAAQRYHMPFDEALAHQALATVAQARGDRAIAAQQRNTALLLFERLGAYWHVADLSRLDADDAS